MRFIILTLLLAGACVAKHKKHYHQAPVVSLNCNCGQMDEIFPLIPQLRTPVISLAEILGEYF